MGVTVLKKYCRKFHIHRWPFRKLNSMSKLIGSVEGTTAGAGQVGTPTFACLSQQMLITPCMMLYRRRRKRFKYCWKRSD